LSKHILDYRKNQTGTLRISENILLQTMTSCITSHEPS